MPQKRELTDLMMMLGDDKVLGMRSHDFYTKNLHKALAILILFLYWKMIIFKS